jgi:ABC-type multidrug transport system permease subunit
MKKDLKKTVREPAYLFLIILFPLVLTLTFGFAFGGIGEGGESTYVIGVVDMNEQGIHLHWSSDFVNDLSSNDMLEIRDYPDNGTAQDDLTTGELHAVIVIPQEFGESCDSFVTNPANESQWLNTTLGVYIDKGSLVASQAVPPIVQQTLVVTLVGEQAISASLPISVGSPSLVEAENVKLFDYFVPGLFAFGALFIIITVSQSFAIDREQGLLRRIRTTPMTSGEFMASHTLSNMILALIQVAVIFAVAFAIGYSPNTGAVGIAMAFLMISVFALCCVGFGLITASIAKSPGAANGIAFIFIMPMMFLGTFVFSSIPSPAIQTAGMFVPSYYVTDALTDLFMRGAPVFSATILVNLAVLSITSIAVLLVGIAVFKKHGTR